MINFEFTVVVNKDNKLADTLLMKDSKEVLDYIELNNINPQDKCYKFYKLKEISFTKTITLEIGV